MAARAGLRQVQRLRRSRSQALHHRSQRRRRGARRRRPRRLARRARAERNPAAARRPGPTATYPGGQAPTNRLYRNRGDGTFEDVTDRAGLRRTGWASSVCAGDYDNDGWIDLFVTYYGRNVLYRNRGDGRFEDVTHERRTGAARATAGDRAARSSTSIATAGSISSSPTTCASISRRRPSPAPGRTASGRAFRSTADRRGCRPTPICSFTTKGMASSPTSPIASGIARVTGRYSMTALAADLDRRRLARHLRRVRLDRRDSLPQQPRRHVHRRRRRERRRVQRPGQSAGRHGRRRRRLQRRRPARPGEDALRRRHPGALPESRQGTVRGRRGRRRGSRVQNRYVAVGHRLRRTSTTTASPTSSYVTGHVYPEIERVLAQYPHRGPRLVFRNRRRRPLRRRERGERRRPDGAALEPRRRVRRHRQRRRRRRAGHEHERAAVAASQRVPRRGNWIRVALEGTASNRAAVGATVVVSAGGRTPGARGAQPVELLLARRSASALRPRRRGAIDEIEVHWPSGRVQRVTAAAVRSTVTIVEPRDSR